MASDELFTRDEALSGLSAQRARTALYLIESRSGHLASRSRRAMSWQVNEQAAQDEDLAFLQAFAEARDPPRRPTIQEIEKSAPAWVEFVPATPAGRAMLARLLADKYRFTFRDVPQIRQALSLDEVAVQQAYQRLYRQPIESIYELRPSFGERAGWSWAKLGSALESLPPFWAAYALTLTETIGAGILAIPIAVAEVGALGGVVLLIVLGAVNLVTIAYMAEAVSRNGSIRYGTAYFGRLVADLLGREGSLIVSLAVVLISVLALMAYFIGFSATLAEATRAPALIWILALFLLDLYFVSRRSLNATVAAALLVGLINIALIAILALLALPYIRQENLAYMKLPVLDGQPFEPGILELAFGVILLSYFGHTSMGNCAKIVLKRDPTGRSLIWGSLLAMISVMILYILWVIAVNGAIPPKELAGEAATALAPLADRVGREVYLFGSLFVILAMGMGSVHLALALYNTVQEWFPIKRRTILSLLPRRSRLIMRRSKDSDGLLLSVVYLGIQDELPCLRLDLQKGQRTFSLDMQVRERLNGRSIAQRTGTLVADEELPLEMLILESSPEKVRLQLVTPLEISCEGEWLTEGADLTGLLTLPADQRQLFNWILRMGEVTPGEAQHFTGKDLKESGALLEVLVNAGYLRVVDGPSGQMFRPRLGAKKSRHLPDEIWEKLEVQPTTAPTSPRPSAREIFERLSNSLVLGQRGRFLLGAAPLLGTALLTAWLVATDSQSFSGTLSFLGTIVISLMGLAFPALLLSASRQKGEYVPAVVFRRIGAPLVASGIFLGSLAVLLLHGLVIWQSPLERTAAIITALVMAVSAALMIRRGIFRPRAVVELRRDHPKNDFASLQITVNGGLSPSPVNLSYRDSQKSLEASCLRVDELDHLESAEVQLQRGEFQDIKVWAHEISALGDSSGLPIRVESDREGQRFDVHRSQGEVVFRPGEAIPAEKYPVRLVLED